MPISAGKAIRIECGCCQDKTRPTTPCQSKNCWLANGTIGSSLRRIKMHCRDCAPDHDVSRCTGWVEGSQAIRLAMMLGEKPETGPRFKCPMWPFRFGKRPGGPSEKQIEAGKRLAALRAAKQDSSKKHGYSQKVGVNFASGGRGAGTGRPEVAEGKRGAK